jgi:hypothetical protein
MYITRSTTYSTLIHDVYPGQEIKFDNLLSKFSVLTAETGYEFLTKINSIDKDF